MAKELPPEVQAIISASDAGYHSTVVELLKPFLVANADSQRGWVDNGHALAHLGRYREAEAAYRRALELTDPADQDSIFGELGNLFRSEGNYEAAADWYRKQIETSPQDATGHLFLGLLEFKRGNHADAIETLQQGLECESVCLEETHFALGNAYRALGEYTLAKAHFEKAIDADAKYEAAINALKDVKKAVASL